MSPLLEILATILSGLVFSTFETLCGPRGPCSSACECGTA